MSSVSSGSATVVVGAVDHARVVVDRGPLDARVAPRAPLARVAKVRRLPGGGLAKVRHLFGPRARRRTRERHDVDRLLGAILRDFADARRRVAVRGQLVGNDNGEGRDAIRPVLEEEAVEGVRRTGLARLLVLAVLPLLLVAKVAAPRRVRDLDEDAVGLVRGGNRRGRGHDELGLVDGIEREVLVPARKEHAAAAARLFGLGGEVVAKVHGLFDGDAPVLEGRQRGEDEGLAFDALGHGGELDRGHCGDGGVRLAEARGMVEEQPRAPALHVALVGVPLDEVVRCDDLVIVKVLELAVLAHRARRRRPGGGARRVVGVVTAVVDAAKALVGCIV